MLVLRYFIIYVAAMFILSLSGYLCQLSRNYVTSTYKLQTTVPTQPNLTEQNPTNPWSAFCVCSELTDQPLGSAFNVRLCLVDTVSENI